MPQLMPLYWSISFMMILFFMLVIVKMYVMCNMMGLSLEYNSIISGDNNWMW